MLVIVAPAPSLAGPITPHGGPYGDHDGGGVDSALEFEVNAAGTRIPPGSKLRAGFPCAPRTVFTTRGAPIADGSLSYEGPVERRSGRPAGMLSLVGPPGPASTTSTERCA